MQSTETQGIPANTTSSDSDYETPSSTSEDTDLSDTLDMSPSDLNASIDNNGYDTEQATNISSQTPCSAKSNAQSRISKMYASSDALHDNLWMGADHDSLSPPNPASSPFPTQYNSSSGGPGSNMSPPNQIPPKDDPSVLTRSPTTQIILPQNVPCTLHSSLFPVFNHKLSATLNLPAQQHLLPLPSTSYDSNLRHILSRVAPWYHWQILYNQDTQHRTLAFLVAMFHGHLPLRPFLRLLQPSAILQFLLTFPIHPKHSSHNGTLPDIHHHHCYHNHSNWQIKS